MSILAVERLDVRHGLLQAVRDVSFSVDKGEVVAFVGANGAGKTTLFRTIAGAHRPSGGRVEFDGRDVTALPDYDRVKRGIALVPEGRRLFSQMTVRENLQISAAVRPQGAVDARRGVACLPQPGRPAFQQGGQSVGWRAAGDRHRPGADGQSRTCS